MTHAPDTAAPALPNTLRNNPLLSRWLRIDAATRTIEVRTGKVEIGQGITTAMAQIAAEELGLSLAQVRMAPVATGQAPDEGITSGSRSISEGGTALRIVCTDARVRLLEAASATLRLDIDRLGLRDGAVLHAGEPTGLDWWNVAQALPAGAAVRLESLQQAALHGRVTGQGVQRQDLHDKVAGRPVFVQDLALPGMLHGRVVRSPAGDQALAAIDIGAVAGLPGVVAAVRDGSFVGIVAQREEQAVRARARALALARWRPHERYTDDASVHAWLQSRPDRQVPILEADDAQAPPTVGGQRLHARYTKPYLAHASIGPSCAVARMQGGVLEVWTHSQSIYPLRAELARVLRMSASQLVVHHVQGAGCYGHNGADDAALDAALLSLAVGGRPVQVQWMREDEFAWEPYGPAMVVEVAATLDGAGGIAQWSLDVWSNGHVSRPAQAPEGSRASSLVAAWQREDASPRAPQLDPPLVHGIAHGGMGRNAATAIYRLPHQRVTAHPVDELPLRGSSLRSIGAYANIFAIESFMDELAQASGIDPLAFRLRHLQDERARAVLERAAHEAGWSQAHATEGAQGRGLACAQYCNHLGYFAAVVELGVDPDLRVQRVVCAVDVGRIINPDGVRNQVEGGIVQAISWTLKEQVRFGADGIRTRSWEDYPILGFADVPSIDVHLIDRPDCEPLGAGEITMGPIAAAIGNAVRDALAVRIRDLPITRERIAAA